MAGLIGLPALQAEYSWALRTIASSGPLNNLQSAPTQKNTNH